MLATPPQRPLGLTVSQTVQPRARLRPSNLPRKIRRQVRNSLRLHWGEAPNDLLPGLADKHSLWSSCVPAPSFESPLLSQDATKPECGDSVTDNFASQNFRDPASTLHPAPRACLRPSNLPILEENHKTPLKGRFVLLEEEGRFELPDPCGSAVFKTAALDRYATPPCSRYYQKNR